MVLHYLGLDHIGHVEGPFSELIKPKLYEMDEIIRTIHLKSEIWNKRTLIVTTGDHGMKDSGGHGGATYNETNVPLIFSGITCSNHSATQIDVSPTLSALLGVEIPHNTLGSVIQSTLQSYDLGQILHIMNCNAHILKKNSQFDDFHDIFEEATIQYQKYLNDKHLHSGKEAIQLYESFIFLSKEKLILSSLTQNEHQLIYSVMLIIISFKNIICYFFNVNGQDKNNFLQAGDIFIVICLLAYFFLPFGYLIIIFTFIATAILFFRNIKVYLHLLQNTNYRLKFLIFSNICHCVSLVSSSFIEEEHQIWYFFWCTTISSYIYLYMFKSLSSFAEFTVILCAFRFVRKLNQTGDKWAHLLDISRWLLCNEHYFYLQAFNIVSLILTYAVLYHSKFFKKTSKLLIIALVISYLMKNVWLHNHLLHKIFYLVNLLMFSNFIRDKQTLSGLVVFWILNIFSSVLRY
ncbi:GPI ethanolamine phosphate transferase 2 [Agrilus planipennis]|uniref:GPI ethanolamine phosphate transferase 2 n=1 Tax=Agrilus planipennis TaxID=224129 RepID=A0A7F5RKS7_AGRPL|nr:GPI ethanolamine phosphate transferase 2 [Agrilus planipennis]